MASAEWQSKDVPQYMFQITSRHFDRFRGYLAEGSRAARGQSKANDDQVLVAARHYWLYVVPKLQIPLGFIFASFMVELFLFRRLPLSATYKGIILLTLVQLLGLVGCWYASVERNYTYWVLTSQRLYIFFLPPNWMFWLNDSQNSILIGEMKSALIDKTSIPLFSRLLHYGKLRIGTLEQQEEDERFTWDFMPYHLEVRDQIQRLLDAEPDRQVELIARGILRAEELRTQQGQDSANTKASNVSSPQVTPQWHPTDPVVAQPFRLNPRRDRPPRQ